MQILRLTLRGVPTSWLKKELTWRQCQVLAQSNKYVAQATKVNRSQLLKQMEDLVQVADNEAVIELSKQLIKSADTYQINNNDELLLRQVSSTLGDFIDK